MITDGAMGGDVRVCVCMCVRVRQREIKRLKGKSEYRGMGKRYGILDVRI